MTNDQELKLQLARLLPEKIKYQHAEGSTPNDSFSYPERFIWLEDGMPTDDEIKETEWLHVCWLIEQTFSEEYEFYDDTLFVICREANIEQLSAPWQQRALAILKTKGID